VTAEWLGEGAPASDASPSYAGPEVDVHKAAAYIQASFEVMQDTNVVGQLGTLLADAKNRLESAAFAIGTGTGQPKGVVTAVAAVAGSIVDSAATSTYAVGDVYSLAAALPPRYRPNATWLMEYETILATRQFAQGPGYPQSAFWADLGMDNPAQLLGKPVRESSEMQASNALSATSGASNYIAALGDFRNYLIVDRIGMTVQFEDLVKDPATGRPNGQAGWFAHWRVGGDCLNADAFRLLDVKTT
jgi:HK97 family phage major capsid protein